MTKLKMKFAILFFSTIVFSSCGIDTYYIGDTLPTTSNVDVFYDAKDVKKDYKVIGHLSIPTSVPVNQAKSKITEKAKAVGSDGIIIHSTNSMGGKDLETLYTADAIKYAN
jgi:hypothetical protein